MNGLVKVLLGLGGLVAVSKLFQQGDERSADDKADTRSRRTPRTFISFDFDHDLDAKTLFVGQAKNSRTPFTVVDASLKRAMPPRKWVAAVRERMSRCDLVVVLVGKRMASARGVHTEVRIARELGVPMFGVYVNDATDSCRLPPGLRRGRVIPWTWGGIAESIDGTVESAA